MKEIDGTKYYFDQNGVLLSNYTDENNLDTVAIKKMLGLRIIMVIGIIMMKMVLLSQIGFMKSMETHIILIV